MRRTAAFSLFFVLAALLFSDGDLLGRKGPAAAAAGKTPLRDVMLVGNNWAGTATIVDAHTLKLLKTGVNFIPDKAQEIADIKKNPAQLAFYYLIQQGPGEGHDQYVDDMFTTKDGRYVAVSRPSFADVVWIDLAKATAGRTDSIVREQQMDGFRTDHMGVSPDGRRLLVSDSTKNQVIEYSMVDETVAGKQIKMGDRMRTFPSGETPHENNYSPDGSLIYHASIGKVYLPGDQHSIGPIKIGPLHDLLKGHRWYEIVNNDDFSIKYRWDMGKELKEAGYDGMSSAVRPMAVAPDQRYLYFQVSYFHGIVEFDTQAPDKDGKVSYTAGGIPEPRVGAVKRLINLPNRVPKMPLENYVNDSAHHGLSMNSAGTTLCAAGTMDDYAAFVDRRTGKAKIFDKASTGHDYLKPYWTTEGLHNTCWISLSDSDAVAVLDFDTARELAFLPVGDHPQRVRHGYVPAALVNSWAPVKPGAFGGPNGGSGGLINTISTGIGALLGLVDPVLPVR
ncbi:serine/threonine protein kinase [Nocardioides marmoriginsengisoli]|uniref:Serine/threonine protein kinase n=1 Tax=Nocardioides marmoriginsengisoli TaxID=661483 RepID=A0A3N0CPB8_9ACTN|nr:serine/threonine protein kinase [Nocardioides marmoriginsengisoli]RNL65308.1 serine/threonine protein kinase [Nocardioides marmoriginsengisoli]